MAELAEAHRLSTLGTEAVAAAELGTSSYGKATTDRRSGQQDRAGRRLSSAVALRTVLGAGRSSRESSTGGPLATTSAIIG